MSPLQFAAVLGAIVITWFIQHGHGGPCLHVFTSAGGPSGTFSSPGYPAAYPPHVDCKYVFSGTKDERIQIVFEDFDLELGTNAGCLFDYIDVFTIDTDNMKNLQERLCGNHIPSPIFSVHQHLELSFKSDYARSKRGFTGKYHFLDEFYTPFRENTRGCGDNYLGGPGGEITSPGYPNPYPGDVSCVWTIKVDHEMKVVLNFIELDLGPSVHCGSTYVAIYNGFAHPDREPATKLCKQTPDNKEFKSKNFRVGLRFLSGSVNEFASRGFRVVWTAVWIPHTSDDAKGGGSSVDRCDEFHCRGEEYCIDTSKVLCNPLPRYCISKTLRCNGVSNCGASDSSDEEGCFTKAVLMASAAVGGSVAAIVAIATATVLWRRRKTAALVGGKQRAQKQDNDRKSQERRPHGPTSKYHITNFDLPLDGKLSSPGRRSPSSRRGSFARATAIDCGDLDLVHTSLIGFASRDRNVGNRREISALVAGARSKSTPDGTTNVARSNGSLKAQNGGRSKLSARSVNSNFKDIYRPLNDFRYEFSRADGVKYDHGTEFGVEGYDDDDDESVEVDIARSNASATTPTATRRVTPSTGVRRHSSSGRIRCKARTGRQMHHQQEQQLLDQQTMVFSESVSGGTGGIIDCDTSRWHSTHVMPTRTAGRGASVPEVDHARNGNSLGRHSTMDSNAKQQQQQQCWMYSNGPYDRSVSPRISAVSSTSSGSKWSTLLGPVAPPGQLQQPKQHQNPYVDRRQPMMNMPDGTDWSQGRHGRQPGQASNGSSIV